MEAAACAAYNVERKVSFRAICAAENREFYTGAIFISPLETSTANASGKPRHYTGKQTIYTFEAPYVANYYFFNFISLREAGHVVTQATENICVSSGLLIFHEPRYEQKD